MTFPDIPHAAAKQASRVPMTRSPGLRILFLTGDVEDYLADSALHGLKRLLGEGVVDYPKCERLYDGFPAAAKRGFHGLGFTIYSQPLPDPFIDRMHIEERIRHAEFDAIIFGDVWRQPALVLALWPAIQSTPVAIMDGADADQPFPYAGLFARRRTWWVIPRVRDCKLYFKREWTPRTHFGFLRQRLPPWIQRHLRHHRSLRPISFSVPREYVVPHAPAKEKLFTRHIVDPTVAGVVHGTSTTKPFDDEREYVADIRASRFGVTMKRSGWDCLRHYELAANGAVPCFRDLDAKPPTCAPHGLGPHNCISYASAEELLDKVRKIHDDEYASLQDAALSWARANTTEARAGELLQALGLAVQLPGAAGEAEAPRGHDAPRPTRMP